MKIYSGLREGGGEAARGNATDGEEGQSVTLSGAGTLHAVCYRAKLSKLCPQYTRIVQHSWDPVRGTHLL